MNKAFLLLCAIAMFFACSTGSLSKKSVPDNDLKTLVQWMTGDFSSQVQSQRDSDYFDIRLHVRPIWSSDKTAHWLYVEQAVASAEDKPYRQRVYKVERHGEKGFQSIVYTLPQPEKWIGAYKTPTLFNTLKPADLSLREGCTVFLERKANGDFEGSTHEADCESTLRGAKYAVSTVTITKKVLKSWDQGFNEKKEQVWGATKGGYEFVRK